MKVIDENSRFRIRIRQSKVWIRGSGSVPKFHGFATLDPTHVGTANEKRLKIGSNRERKLPDARSTAEKLSLHELFFKWRPYIKSSLFAQVQPIRNVVLKRRPMRRVLTEVGSLLRLYLVVGEEAPAGSLAVLLLLYCVVEDILLPLALRVFPAGEKNSVLQKYETKNWVV